VAAAGHDRGGDAEDAHGGEQQSAERVVTPYRFQNKRKLWN
jgi:hypothetical protein